jgi:hypothetical protein
MLHFVFRKDEGMEDFRKALKTGEQKPFGTSSMVPGTEEMLLGAAHLVL